MTSMVTIRPRRAALLHFVYMALVFALSIWGLGRVNASLTADEVYTRIPWTMYALVVLVTLSMSGYLLTMLYTLAVGLGRTYTIAVDNGTVTVTTDWFGRRRRSESVPAGWISRVKAVTSPQLPPLSSSVVLALADGRTLLSRGLQGMSRDGALAVASEIAVSIGHSPVSETVDPKDEPEFAERDKKVARVGLFVLGGVFTTLAVIALLGSGASAPSAPGLPDTPDIARYSSADIDACVELFGERSDVVGDIVAITITDRLPTIWISDAIFGKDPTTGLLYAVPLRVPNGLAMQTGRGDYIGAKDLMLTVEDDADAFLPIQLAAEIESIGGQYWMTQGSIDTSAD